MSEINLRSNRAQQARLGSIIGKTGYKVLLVIVVVCVVAVGWFIAKGPGRYAYLLSVPAIIAYMIAMWWRKQLSLVPALGQGLDGRLSSDVLSRLKPNIQLTPQTLWQAIMSHWQASFLIEHLLLTSKMVEQNLSQQSADLDSVWQIATQLADQDNSPVIELGFVAAGLLQTSPGVQKLLTETKLAPDDIEEVGKWLARAIKSLRPVHESFGGVGRDWTFGFTPQLDHYGENISSAITNHGSHFGWLTTSPGVIAIESAFDNHAGAIALVGPDGIGKTSHVYALAQKLIEGKTSQTLAYHQVIGLSASQIIAAARQEGELEHLINGLLGEAVHAGHVILFLDNAELFFGDGPGTLDATNILLPVVQNRAVPLILAMTPQDFQHLRTTNSSFASLLTPVVLSEPPQSDVMRILEDTAVNFEAQYNVLIAYEALPAVFRLSGRYDQDTAYPGKAIKLLEQAVSHAEQNIVTAKSVEQTLEQTQGVKVGTAAAPEANALLHLEDKIHERMINQSHAVSVVASALRRARAGVSDPKRPIGSFLFLGPTGVGKTELAKSVAAEYFGNETTMIRLDMSEYQQPDDVQRLLTTGQHDTSSLLMSVRQQPFNVVLLDEIEKAHPNILNLLLQLLDEGQLTDESGRPASFKDCIIIATSNAGAETIRKRITAGESLENFRDEFTNQLMSSGQFKPELLNRFDEIVLFRPLKPEELAQVVQLMINDVNATLNSQNVSVALTPTAIQKIVEIGNDPRLGARQMRRALQHAVEDGIAQRILAGQTRPGDHVTLDVTDLNLES
ncbi:MAG TPA: AAA family ATPase [Candidatus Saccharimonadales bacterium]|nr:AAA family ATPase [Candidatus Saccharimonadales bacterium]